MDGLRLPVNFALGDSGARKHGEMIRTRRPVRIVRTIAAAALLSLAACPQDTSIWLLSGELPGRPVFGVGRTRDGASLRELRQLAITPCSTYEGTTQAAVWLLVRAKEAPAPRQVTFGQAPVSYRIVRGPDRLEPGCYVAEISPGSGRMRFEVRGDRSSMEVAGT